MPDGFCSHRFRSFVLIAGCAALAGCTQMIKHSNTLVFGTNTDVGISVGVTASTTPTIAIGYKRQEAVVMPLVANTQVDEKTGEMKPCFIGPDVGTHVEHIPDSCLLVGKRGESLDAYSVLASFGGSFRGASGSGAEASGAVAQYFATGVAAQILATSGAALVAVGSAANEDAKAEKSAGITAVLANPAVLSAAQAEIAQTDVALGKISAIVSKLEQDKLPDALAALRKGLKITPDSHDLVAQACPQAASPQACGDGLKKKLYPLDSSVLNDGLQELIKVTGGTR